MKISMTFSRDASSRASAGNWIFGRISVEVSSLELDQRKL